MKKSVKTAKRCPTCNQTITKGTKITNVSLNLGIFYGGAPNKSKIDTDDKKL